MPITKSAIKKVRQVKKRTKQRKIDLASMKEAIKKIKKTKKYPDLTMAISLIDKSVKKKLIHKNKAARLKSSLSKLVK